MNNRYLYRAKRTDNGEWVEGNLVWSDDADDDYKSIIIPTTNSNMFTKGGSRGDLGFENWCRVDPSTICQCTGLKDKNGKLIWENDIVKHDFGKDQIGVQLAIVKYDSKYACYQIKPIYDWMYCDKSDCEVIGNIFDNPELLEVGE